MWQRLRNVEKKKSLSFLPPWEFQTPLSSSGTSDFLSTCLETDSLTCFTKTSHVLYTYICMYAHIYQISFEVFNDSDAWDLFLIYSVYAGQSCSLVRISSESCPWSSLAWQLRMKGKISELGTKTKTLWTQIVRTIWLEQSSGSSYGRERRFPVMVPGGFFFFFAGIYHLLFSFLEIPKEGT